MSRPAFQRASGQSRYCIIRDSKGIYAHSRMSSMSDIPVGGPGVRKEPGRMHDWKGDRVHGDKARLAPTVGKGKKG